jgi:hypothetical protein
MNSLSLLYQGYFNDSITGQLTALTDSALLENRFDTRTRHRVKALLVEQVHNIQRYSSRSRQGCVEIGKTDGILFVKTINPISTEARQQLNARLSGLAEADGPTLKKKYREELKSPFANDSSRAGLGFLYLAQKSSRVDYLFRQSESHECHFEFTSYL